MTCVRRAQAAATCTELPHLARHDTFILSSGPRVWVCHHSLTGGYLLSPRAGMAHPSKVNHQPWLVSRPSLSQLPCRKVGWVNIKAASGRACVVLGCMFISSPQTGTSKARVLTVMCTAAGLLCGWATACWLLVRWCSSAGGCWKNLTEAMLSTCSADGETWTDRNFAAFIGMCMSAVRTNLSFGVVLLPSPWSAPRSASATATEGIPIPSA